MRSPKSSYSPSFSPVRSRRLSQSPHFSSHHKCPKFSSEQIIEEVHKITEKISTSISASNVIKNSNEPMRCLAHNSVLSMYCENEQKLLCANCLFRNHSHKLHKVYPIEKCYEMLAKDINELSVRNERYLILVQNAIRSLIESIQHEEILANKAINKLSQEYDQLHLMLNTSFENARKKLAAEVEESFEGRRKVILGLEQLREIIETNRIKKDENDELESLKKSINSLAFQHSTCKHLEEAEKLSLTQVLSNQPTYVKTFENKELDKIVHVKEIINKWKENEYKRKIGVIFTQGGNEATENN